MDLVVAEQARELGADPAAFRAFFEEALPRVYGYFLRRCSGVVSVAEDLTQETFLAAVAELKKGRAVEAPIPWVYGIARHKLLDHYRTQARRERSDPAEAITIEEPAVGCDSSSPEPTVAALSALPATQRAVLVLCYVDGFSAREVAVALGKTTTAVHSLLERGRENFKRAYLEVRDEHA